MKHPLSLISNVYFSRVYGVDLGYFFSGPTQLSLAITRQAHIRQERRSPHSAIEFPMHRSPSTSRVVSKVIEIPPGVTWSIGTAGTRTEVTVYVLEGILHLAMLDLKKCSIPVTV